MSSYYRKCRDCGKLIQIRQMPEGQWVAFEDYDTVHACRSETDTFPTAWKQPGTGRPIGSEKGIGTLIEQAIQKNQVVRITYISQYRGYPDRTTREIEPYRKEGRLVRAYCRLRSAGRTFRLDRIQTAELTGEEFSARPQMQGSDPRTRTYRPPKSQTAKSAGCLALMLMAAGTIVILSVL